MPRKLGSCELLVSALLLAAIAVRAQTALDGNVFLFPNVSGGAQAESAEELDAFGLAMESRSPADVIINVERFCSEFPNSQFRAQARLLEMRAEIAIDSYTVAIGIGEHLIRQDPTNLEAQLLLAEILPAFPSSYPRKTAALAEADKCLIAAQTLLLSFHKPNGMDTAEFVTNKRALQTRVHEAAGFQALVSGHYGQAITEYEWVKTTESVASLLSRFRLGTAYLCAGNKELARTEFEAVKTGADGVLQSSASAELRRLANSDSSRKFDAR